MAMYGAEQIIELEFLEAVRRRPGMYIGNNNVHGLHQLLLEVLDNSVDECTSGDATEIKVLIEKDGSVAVSDNGRGIPVEYKPDSKMSALTQVLVKPHAGGKFGGSDSAYSTSGGLHGIGLKCTNAFSNFLEVSVRRHGLLFKQRFENGGLPVTGVEIFDSKGEKIGVVDEETTLIFDKKEIATKIEKAGKKTPVDSDPNQGTGTMMRFRPNRVWFSKEMEWLSPKQSVPWNTTRLDTRFRQITHLFPGVKIIFIDKRQSPAEEYTYYSKNGLQDFLDYLNEGLQPLHKPILFTDTAEIDAEEGKAKVTVEVALQYAGEETQIYSFVNAIPTPLGGTHIAAFKAGLTKAVKQFATSKKLIKADEDFKGDDALLGLTAVVKLSMSSTPQFLSQTKESLTSPEVHGPVLSATYNAISEYLEKHYPVGKIIVNQAIAAARGREAAAQARKLVIKKSSMDAGEFVLGKLADIQRRGGNPTVPLDFTALYLVEGDSAGGSCKQGRDSKYHAILPLRGKIPNVEKMKINDILKNREIASIIAALGIGVGGDCNIDNIRYGRVVILVDADVDGSHIATLLATLFWRTMRPIIEAGRLFVARPPLYLAKNKKTSESIYLYTDEERQNMASEWGGEDKMIIQRYKGLGEMNPEQLRETVFVLPESVKKNGKKLNKNQGEQVLSLEDFARMDIRMTIQDVHRTRSLIEQLMGSDVGPRKKWLLNVDWNEEE